MNPSNSLASDAWSALSKNRAAWFSAIALTTMVLLVLLGPLVSPHEVDQTNWSKLAKPPSMQDGHIFGTDDLGRDLFVRTMYGGRISLMVGIVATLVSVLIGVSYGAISGFVGGKVDSIMMRIVDVLYAMPFLFFVILLMVFFGRSIFLIFVAIGAVNWLDIARIVRGQTLTIKGKRICRRRQGRGCFYFPYNIPTYCAELNGNSCGLRCLNGSSGDTCRVVLEFLRFGSPGAHDVMGRFGESGRQTDGILTLDPSFSSSFLAVTLFCFNFIGDGLRDALDPKDRTNTNE